MWSVRPYVNFGVEYNYGRRNVKAGPFRDNHRVLLGFQFF
jgi:hypothetical protein